MLNSSDSNLFESRYNGFQFNFKGFNEGADDEVLLNVMK